MSHVELRQNNCRIHGPTRWVTRQIRGAHKAFFAESFRMNCHLDSALLQNYEYEGRQQIALLVTRVHIRC